MIVQADAACSPAGWADDLLGVSVSDALVLDRPLRDWQSDARKSVAQRHSGLELGSGDALYVTDEFIDGLVAVAAGRPVASVRVRAGKLHDEFGPNRFGARRVGQLLEYNLALAGKGNAALAARAVLTMALEEVGVSRPQPGRMANPIFAPAGRRQIWSVGHWMDLLVINLLALSRATGAITATTRDAGCEVHPTAVIENSVLGRGVKVGPLAVVRNSILKDGCEIQEQVSVARSVIGPESIAQTSSLVHDSVVGDSTVLSFQTATRGSLLLGHSTISTPVVARSVIGRNTFLARGMRIAAGNLSDEPVRVHVCGTSVDTGMRLLGCAVGKGARVGDGIATPPGFEIPADQFLTQRPLRRIGSGLPKHTPLVHVDGHFRQLSFRSKGSS